MTPNSCKNYFPDIFRFSTSQSLNIWISLKCQIYLNQLFDIFVVFLFLIEFDYAKLNLNVNLILNYIYLLIWIWLQNSRNRFVLFQTKLYI
ncbi:unnamed protein product [Blepharisma stoltei]|uniref:Transmembrane protein n=1 Tax=Blepharisma stoltei TaxID=1481888 RepID=A0AAU9J2Z7_9CILI|nr:unnamed protein product [Blepharisma stoltei]